VNLWRDRYERRYLDALGYSLGIVVMDQETGEVVANVGMLG
jgi:hypothetical protein